MSAQPEALRLAASLELCWGDSRLDEAAAELRRLHYADAQNEAWIEKTEWVQKTATDEELGMHRADVIKQRFARLSAQRDELLEALQSTADLLQVWIDGAPPYDEAQNDWEILAKARSAIAKAGGAA